MSRPVVEPGGVLLIGIGLAESDLRDWVDLLYPQSACLSVVIGTDQQRVKINADEILVYGPLGLRGALAFIRRISWRHFELVVQPQSAGLPYLRHFIWPKPAWRHGQYLVDFRP